MKTEIFKHNDRWWRVREIEGAWFVEDGNCTLTGPYNTHREALEWVLVIKPQKAAR